MRVRTTAAGRPAYTMVELLVVIAIIAVLVSLLTAAVQKARVSMKKATTATDISQLATSTTTFKTDHGFYPPSHVTMTDTGGNQVLVRFRVPVEIVDPTVGTNDQRQQYASYAVLRRMFPRWNPAAGVITPSLPRAGEVLSSNAALVYFLSGPAGQGWDSASPYSPAGTTKKAPYYNFESARVNAANEYLDIWKVPFAYFASDSGRDTYDPRVYFPWSGGGAADPAPDPATLVAGTAHPYHDGNKWLNPGSFQIISAGPDKIFGPGSPRTVAGGAPTAWLAGQGLYVETLAGADDIANFNEGTQLGG